MICVAGEAQRVAKKETCGEQRQAAVGSEEGALNERTQDSASASYRPRPDYGTSSHHVGYLPILCRHPCPPSERAVAVTSHSKRTWIWAYLRSRVFPSSGTGCREKERILVSLIVRGSGPWMVSSGMDHNCGGFVYERCRPERVIWSSEDWEIKC
jgi:hypothetical protein